MKEETIPGKFKGTKDVIPLCRNSLMDTAVRDSQVLISQRNVCKMIVI